ncbi:MAG: RluA family pseudouridine synthase [Ruminococcaceae bacterium]|nr:RluA family pseudouridine synthase [Oscillospiraceae bacterium]
MRKIDYVIESEFDGDKVLWYLRGQAKLSARLVASLKTFPEGILLNGGHIRTIDRIHTGDILTVNIPEGESTAQAREGELEVVYEDDDILIINKSPFIAVHPTHNHQGDTLANVVTGYLQKKNKDAVFRAVGRLDKGTSGLMMIALNGYAASRLSEDGVSKEYIAITEGVYTSSGTIDKPIYRPDPMKTLRAAGDEGDRAVTHYSVEAHDNERSLLRVWLETGRTHQIRVHFSHMGTPLVGDDMYGKADDEIKRHALHCEKMVFCHPVTGKMLSVTAPLWEDMEKLKEKIEKNM